MINQYTYEVFEDPYNDDPSRPWCVQIFEGEEMIDFNNNYATREEAEQSGEEYIQNLDHDFDREEAAYAGPHN